MRLLIRRAMWLGGVVQIGLLASPLWAAPALSQPPATEKRVELRCDAVYLPARSSWMRGVDIRYDERRVRSVHVDGQPVHSFSVQGATILTALDNERIQIDLDQQTWRSDFRGRATAQGRCERLD